MVRKRIPLVTRPDAGYSASLQPRQDAVEHALIPPSDPGPTAERHPATEPVPSSSTSQDFAGEEQATSTQIDVRVTALERQSAQLRSCGINPCQVIRAAMRKAVKRWSLSADFHPKGAERRSKNTAWTVRTSVAVPAAVFDRLQAAEDPLGVCSRWSLVRGQLEPLVWEEIDRLLASLVNDAESS